MEAAKPIVKEQLAIGGFRLAKILTKILQDECVFNNHVKKIKDSDDSEENSKESDEDDKNLDDGVDLETTSKPFWKKLLYYITFTLVNLK